MKKILSISIAAYNVAATLAETLDSLVCCGEALSGLDIMVIDDGSRDATAEIAQRYVALYPDSVRLLQKKNGGWGSTVNTGIQNARGLYFRQLDGDDAFESKNLGGYLAALEKSTADLVINPYLTYDEADGAVISREDCNPGCETGRCYPLAEVAAFKPFMHSLAVRSACIRTGVEITEHCFYTDTEFVLKSCCRAKTVEFLPDVIYRYRRAALGQSMSLDGIEKHYQDQSKVICELLKTREEQFQNKAVQKIFDSLLFSTCCWQYLVFLYLRPTAQHKRELREFDEMLRKKAPRYYDEIDIPLIHLLRKTGFVGYPLAARYKKWRDHRFTDSGRLRA